MENLNTVRKIFLSIASAVIIITSILTIAGANEKTIIYTVIGILVFSCIALIKKIYENIKENYLDEKIINKNIERILSFSNEEFIRYLKLKFVKEGYEFKEIKDLGNKFEILIEKNNIKTILYAIRANEIVNAYEIYEIMNLKEKYKASRGIIITTGTFTRTVYDLAKDKSIRLVNIEELAAEYSEKE